MDRISKLKEYLEISEKDNFLQHALALEYIKTGNDFEAKKQFENILKTEPDYVGSYYHFGKLLERIGEPEAAIGIYEKGIEVAKKINDRHSMSELQAAWEELNGL